MNTIDYTLPIYDVSITKCRFFNPIALCAIQILFPRDYTFSGIRIIVRVGTRPLACIHSENISIFKKPFGNPTINAVILYTRVKPHGHSSPADPPPRVSFSGRVDSFFFFLLFYIICYLFLGYSTGDDCFNDDAVPGPQT